MFVLSPHLSILKGLCLISYVAIAGPSDKGKLVALGTGNGVASGATVTQDGRTVLDCHGVAIARRGLQRQVSNTFQGREME